MTCYLFKKKFISLRRPPSFLKRSSNLPRTFFNMHSLLLPNVYWLFLHELYYLILQHLEVSVRRLNFFNTPSKRSHVLVKSDDRDGQRISPFLEIMRFPIICCTNGFFIFIFKAEPVSWELIARIWIALAHRTGSCRLQVETNAARAT